MTDEKPLTHAEKEFASDHHNLVYEFLHKHHLPIDEFYDIVIFGYLDAVRTYLSRADLQIYAFPTLGWKLMTQSLSDFYKEQACQKRNSEISSLHTKAYADNLPLEETIPTTYDLMQQLEVELLLHDLAKRVSKQQMEIVRLKSSGYKLQDIATRQNTSTKRIRNLLEEVRCVLAELCRE